MTTFLLWKYGLLGIVGGILFLLEYFFHYRTHSERKWRRIMRNILLGIIGGSVVAIVYGSVLGVAHFMTLERDDVWKLMFLPEPVRVVLFLLLFDAVMYVWHIANHQVRVLWRFHKVHHSDHDLDFSTAVRFHGGELFLAVLVKGFFVYITGVPPLWIVLFDAVVTAFALFNHSNLYLGKIEPHVRRVIVTPSMHRIHHSQERAENDSNYGTIFSIWDRLFKTMLFSDRHKDVHIGIKQFPKAKDTTFFRLLIMPFRK